MTPARVARIQMTTMTTMKTTTTRTIRVRATNGAFFADLLRDAGFDAEWLGAGTAPTRWGGGCGDPSCCIQHPGATDHPEEWGAIRTTASGSAARRVWRAAGVV